jgi:membrane protease YdiL (CAAX protease family)
MHNFFVPGQPIYLLSWRMVLMEICTMPFLVGSWIYFARTFGQHPKARMTALIWTAIVIALSCAFWVIVSNRAGLFWFPILAFGTPALLSPFLFVVIYDTILVWDDRRGSFWYGNATAETFTYQGVLLLIAMLLWSYWTVGKTVNSVAPNSWIAWLEKICLQGAEVLSEEFFYRGFILCALLRMLAKVRGGVLAAIFVSSIVFASAHTDLLHPALRYAQILPIGVGLAVVFPRFGLIRTTGIHLTFNLLLPVTFRILGKA